MVNSYQTEQSNKVRGLMISLLIHAALILIFLFFYLKPPNPPLTDISLGGGGVELNLGDPLAGTHDLSNLTASSAEPETPTEETSVAEPVTEEQTEESTPDEGVNIEATETDHEDAVAVKTSPKVNVKTETPVKKEEPKKEVTPTPVVNNSALLKKNNGSTSKSGEDKNTPGDPGQKEGTVDGKALMGKPGKGGDGSSAGIGLGGGLVGWKFVTKPIVNDQTQEKGTLIFKIYVNDEGIIEVAKVIENRGGITPKLQAAYQNALLGIELALLDPSKKIPPRSEGTVTWEIKPQ